MYIWQILMIDFSKSIKRNIHIDERTMIINVALEMLIYFPLEQHSKGSPPLPLHMYRKAKGKLTK